MVNERVAYGIVEALGISAGEGVLEIGPGRGALTQFIVGRTAELTLVELDRHLAADLRRRWGSFPGVTLVEADFMKWALPDRPEGGLKVISNLPYSAANAILRKLLDWPVWSEAVVMVQKEVAVRMAAKPGSGDYGVLSLAIQAKAEPTLLFDVRPGSFNPPPKVTSTVLRLKRLPAPRIKDEEVFFRVVHAAFHQRRKTLSNSLSHGLEMEKPRVEEALRSVGIDPGARAETVDLEGFNRLTAALGPAAGAAPG